MEWKIGKPGRACVSCGRQFSENEEFFSCLLAEPQGMTRQDYCLTCWKENRPKCISYWRSRVPPKQNTVPKIPPTRRLLELFDSLPPHELAHDPETTLRIRYVLALLLMQKRVLKLVDTIYQDEYEDMILYCQTYGRTYRVRVCVLNPEDEQRVTDQLKGALES